MRLQAFFLLFLLAFPLSACQDTDVLPEWMTGDPVMEPIPQAKVQASDWRSLGKVPERPSVPDMAVRPAQVKKLQEENNAAATLQQKYNPAAVRQQAE